MNIEMENRAIERIRAFEPESEPYYLCYSGGKDSDCIRILAELAGVKHDIVHNLTTADAPETIYYINSISDVKIEKPDISMWDLIPKKMFPPTRLIRYCCSEFKEGKGKGRVKITGVRWDESDSRTESYDLVKVIGKPKTMMKNASKEGVDFRQTKHGGIVMNSDNAETRRFVEQCYRTTSTMINPIVDWTENDVWQFLSYYGCKSNPLYQCGFKRVGCIGCPLGGYKSMKKEFALYPKYRAMYVSAFNRMIKNRQVNGLPVDDTWRDGESVMRWWYDDDPSQLTLLDLYENQLLESI